MGKESFSASAGSSPEVQPSKPLGVGSAPTRAEAAAAEAPGRGAPRGDRGEDCREGPRKGGLSPFPTPHRGAGNGGWAADPLLLSVFFFFLKIFKDTGFKVHPKKDERRHECLNTSDIKYKRKQSNTTKHSHNSPLSSSTPLRKIEPNPLIIIKPGIFEQASRAYKDTATSILEAGKLTFRKLPYRQSAGEYRAPLPCPKRPSLSLRGARQDPITIILTKVPISTPVTTVTHIITTVATLVVIVFVTTTRPRLFQHRCHGHHTVPARPAAPPSAPPTPSPPPPAPRKRKRTQRAVHTFPCVRRPGEGQSALRGLVLTLQRLRNLVAGVGGRTSHTPLGSVGSFGFRKQRSAPGACRPLGLPGDPDADRRSRGRDPADPEQRSSQGPSFHKARKHCCGEEKSRPRVKKNLG